MSENPSSSHEQVQPRHFATTQWSVVLAAGNAQHVDARAALASLCEAYWYPLYAYVRRRGHAAADAQDLTQAFFARLLEKESLQVADPQRGKFRSFLLASLDHFLANERERAGAQKRGGGRLPISLDLEAGESRVSLEPAHGLTPQRLYERQWALTLLETVVNRLAAEFAAAGKSRQFALLKDSLTGDRERLAHSAIATELGMSPEAVRQAAHRLRKRYRAILREEVARTVNDPGEVDQELACLLSSLAT